MENDPLIPFWTQNVTGFERRNKLALDGANQTRGMIAGRLTHRIYTLACERPITSGRGREALDGRARVDAIAEPDKTSGD